MRGAEVAPAAERVRAAFGDHVRRAAVRAHALGMLGEERVAIAPRRPRDPRDIGAGEPIEQDVAGRGRRVRRIVAAQDQDAAQAEPGRGERGRARVVALLAAARQYVGRAGRDRLGHQIFQLADLVAG